MTTIGLLSDSHGRADTARAGVELLISNGAEILIHLGDVGSAEVIDAMAVTQPETGQQIESHLVFGNCDWEQAALTRYASDLGVNVHGVSGTMTVDGRRLVFTHGHVNPVMHEAIQSGADYLLHGHTHRQTDETVRQTRVINPGALFRASRHTVALLTPASGELQVLEVASVVR